MVYLHQILILRRFSQIASLSLIPFPPSAPPPSICRKNGEDIMLIKSNREPAETIKSPEVICLHSINRSMALTARLVLSLISPMPQPSNHSLSINSAAQILQDPEQHVDEGPCQETCSPLHPTEILLLLFLPSSEHTHLPHPFFRRGKNMFAAEGEALHLYDKGWKAWPREWLLV